MTFFKRLSLSLSAAALLLGLILFSSEVSESVISAVKRCTFSVIPSLFAFMAASKLLISTGIAQWLFAPFDKLFEIIFRLPKGCGAIFVISNLAGYPVGCAMLKELTDSDRLDKRSAETMSIFCCGAGPAFLIGTVGAGVFGLKKAGTLIFLSSVFSNLLIAAIVCRIYKPKAPLKTDRVSRKKLSAATVTAVTDASEDMFRMCGIIIFFAALITVADKFGLVHTVGKLLRSSQNDILIRSFIEITSLTELKPTAFGALPYISGLCSFGGLCVLMQLKAIIGESFSIAMLLKWLPLKFALNFGIMKLLSAKFLSESVPAFVQSGDIIVRIDNFIPSICLIMMIFILLFQKRLDFLKGV